MLCLDEKIKWKERKRKKIVKGKKISGKWVDSEMIWWMFGTSKSDRKWMERMSYIFVNDIYTL